MGYIKTIFLVLMTVSTFASASLSERWLQDFSKAQETAKDQNRPLLIAFLGPDWCPCSDKLEEEILTSHPFLAALSDDLIFLRVDVAETYSEEEMAVNGLKEKYQIEMCPSLVLAEASGHEIAKIENFPDEGRELAGYIKEMLSDYHRVSELAKKKKISELKFDELKSLYTRAQQLADSTFKNILLKEGLKVDEGPYFLLEQYGQFLSEGGIKSRKSKAIRNKIIARDLNNEQGYRRQLALMDFNALANLNKPKEANSVVKPLLDYLRKFGNQDVENAWQIEMKISGYLFSQDQIEEALVHANASLKIAPESARSEIVKSVEYLKTFLN